MLSRQKGSHLIYRRPESRSIVIPNHREVKTPVIQNILRRAGISLAEYFEFLDRL
ncbi:MAG: type II toxin-antitoxin system HicA family toxin [Candidatus Tectomicrobia bacterium]|nr:type II toxin-antitoxin system HicA family toxin [Candidatus Tectomicrobia bacterium]